MRHNVIIPQGEIHPHCCDRHLVVNKDQLNQPLVLECSIFIPKAGTQSPLQDEMDADERSTAQKIRYRYITILREPVARYLSEWLHTQRGADWPTLHKCLGHLPSLADFPPCHKGLTWINVTLEAFMNCSTNPALNRQTYMLANMRQVNCYNLTGMEDHVRQKRILSSAKINLLSMPFYAMMDFMNESIFLLQHSMGISLKNKTKINHKPRISSLRFDQQILEKIKELNRLDIELYDFAKKLFFLRLKSAKEEKFNSSIN